MRARTLILASPVAAVVVGPALLRIAGWSPVASAPWWIVVLAAGATVAVAISLAKVTGLAGLVAGLAGRRTTPEQIAAELAEIAGLARRDGLLPAVHAARAGGYATLVAGLHLLIRDADDKLLRSALEADAERRIGRTMESRALAARLCRLIVVAALVLAAAAAAWLGAHASAPWGIPSGAAALIGLAVAGLAISQALAERVSDALEARNAADVFTTDACVQAGLAIAAGEDAVVAARRLARLSPAGAGARAPVAARRAA